MSSELYREVQRLSKEVDVLGKVCTRLVARVRVLEKNSRKPPRVEIADTTPRPTSLRVLGIGKDPE